MSSQSLVEVHDLDEAHNGRRARVLTTNGKRAHIRFCDDQSVVRGVPLKNLCSVFALGVPREYDVTVEHADRVAALAKVLSTIDVSKFYVFYMATTGDATQHFLKFHLGWLKFVMRDIAAVDREPLLRVYVTTHLVADPKTKMLFSDQMTDAADLDALYVDLWPDEVIRLSTQIGNETDANMTSEVKRCQLHASVASS